MTPQRLYDALFHAVQCAPVFEDGKAFADAIPRLDPVLICQHYETQRTQAGFDLQAFVRQHFNLPEEVLATPAPRGQTTPPPLLHRIQDLWPELTRKTGPVDSPWDTLQALPHPFVVPGGRFREQYYWDSLFTMQGLALQGQADTVQGMLQNFAYQLRQHGCIANSNRRYMATRSQPPLFYQMVARFAADTPQAGWARFLPELCMEHRFWMEGAEQLMPGQAHRRVMRLPSGLLLNRYWDDSDLARDESYREDVSLAQRSSQAPAALYRALRAGAESGWDFSSRWCRDPQDLASIETPAIVPVDLNAWLFGLECAIATGAQFQGDVDLARRFEALSAARWQAMRGTLWSPAAEAYVDLHGPSQQQRPGLYAASVVPLYVGLASPQEAAATATMVQTHLLAAHGLKTSTVSSSQQWDGANGWAPLQLMAVEGLARYGHVALARELATRWLGVVERVYAQTGCFLEKYDVEQMRSGGGGEYLTQTGFGWTNASVVVLDRWLST